MSSELAALNHDTTLNQKLENVQKIGISDLRQQGDGAPQKELNNTEVCKTAPEKFSHKSNISFPDSPLTMDLKLNVPWVILVGASFATRMWQLTVPSHVVFDEVHFGRFTSLFIQQKFFFDVHPPFGKLLLALAGYLSGFDGSFMFDQIGSDLGDYEYYVWCLRSVSAFLGSLIVPCIYEIIIELGCSHLAASLGAFLGLLENMMIVQSRFVLIDAPLLFFTILSVLSYLKFRRQNNSPFSKRWWLWLLCTGVSLTAVISVKYTGILTVILVGGLTCIDLWHTIGDKTVSDKQLSKHFISRAMCLIANPVFLYLMQFYIMFTLLSNSGPHDDMMSSAFQASLKGGLTKITHGQAEEVAYGSQVTLRNTFGRQCWLHSHAHTYPVKYPDGRGSSAQQQVTCYSFKDVNNWWIIKDPKKDELTVSFPPKPVQNGDIVQLVHGITGRALNSHDVAAPLSPTNQEVSCYIDYNISMASQNLWRVEILNPDDSNLWKTIHSQVRLVHMNTSQAVKTTGVPLPDWGFKQFEVVTDRVLNQQDTIWNVEEHQQNISYPDGTTKMKTEADKPATLPSEVPVKPMPFFSKFWEVQNKMLRANKDLNQEHTFSSRPSHWPFMRRGVAYWIDKSRNMQIYCIGNPVVWWAGTAGVPVYLGLLLIYLLRRRRGINDLDNDSWEQFTFAGYVLVGGYFVHFVPYFPMERTLFVHQYLPALLFKILLLPFLAEHIHNHVFRHRYLRYLVIAGCVLLALLVLGTFQYFSPFTYGHVELTSAEISSRKWLKTWDMLAHPNT